MTSHDDGYPTHTSVMQQECEQLCASHLHASTHGDDAHAQGLLNDENLLVLLRQRHVQYSRTGKKKINSWWFSILLYTLVLTIDILICCVQYRLLLGCNYFLLIFFLFYFCLGLYYVRNVWSQRLHESIRCITSMARVLDASLSLSSQWTPYQRFNQW